MSRIINMVETHPTKILCLMHSKVATSFQHMGLVTRNKDYGLEGKYKSTLIYEVPFHNASIGHKEEYYLLLKQMI